MKKRTTHYLGKCSLTLAVCCLSLSGSAKSFSAPDAKPNAGVTIGVDASGNSLRDVLINSGHFIPGKTGAKSMAAVAVSGKVSDENGIGLPGVTVVLKGTTIGTATNASGEFNLNIPDGQESRTLVFSFIGYITQEVQIGNQAVINIKLLPDSKALEEVVVVGYGTQTRGTVTGAVSQIESKDISRTTATTATGALVGKIQGITARQADARPGAGTSIQVRNMGNPLYVIDGITSDADQFNNLDVNDIESVSVLKDASAAIYGLRAANGVILVTTKKGKGNQKPKISLNTYYGLQDFTRYPRPANAYQHMRGLVENAQNLGRPAPISPEELEKWRLGTEKGYESTDYYSMVMDKAVPQYYLNASASGGSENTNYHFSVSHVNQDALIKDYNFNRTNFQANIESRLAKGLRVGTQIYGRVEDRFQVGVPGLDDYFNPFLSIFTMWPTERPYANDNPNYINQTHNVNVNPATYKKEVTGYIEEVTRAAKGNFYAQYDFDFGLTAKATYSYNFTNFDFDGFEYTYNAYTYNPTTDTYDLKSGNQNPWRERRKRNVVDKFAQFQLNYNKQFGDHGVSAVAAYERQDMDNKYMIVHTVPPNNYVPIMYFANQDYLLDEWNVSARVGYIGRVNYNYKEKYLLEVLGRYDGSFLFAPGKRFGLFPGVSLGYRVSEEDFIKDNVSFLNDLKIRASWGKTGSDIISGNNYVVAPFSYLGGYTFNQGSAMLDGTYYSGLRPRGLPITNLSWITNTTRNIGIDFTIFRNLRGQFDVFERKREGLPAGRYDVLLPNEVGYGLPAENLLSEANRGLEGALSYSGNIGELSYNVGMNATFARRYDIAQQYKPRFGNSWDEYRNSWMDRWGSVNWGYQVIGQFQSQEEIDNYPVIIDGQGNRNLLPGDFIYKDVNGDNVINGLDERPIGYQQGANPYVSFGINTGVQYKGISLMMDFAGATMQSYRRNWELMYPYQNDGTSPDFMLEDRWHREDPFNSDSRWVSGTYPAIRRERAGHNYRHSDFWVTNVRYIRLRNLELGYNIPEHLINKIGLSALRVYANGTNLFSIDNTKVFGIDPEISSGNGLQYPQQRIYTLGFNLSF